MKRFFSFILAFYTTLLFGQVNHPKLEITQLTGDFYVYKTYQTYKGKSVSANAMYVVIKEGVIMLDSPWDSTQFQPLLDSIQYKHHKNVIMHIATHYHEDRAGGLEFLKQKGIKTYTSKQTDKILAESNKPRAEFTFEKDTSFNIGKLSFQTFYGGAGHTPDNIVILFKKEKIIYGGCLIKSTDATDLGNITEANLKAWPIALNNLKRKLPNPQFVITGHDSWTNKGSIDHTLTLLKQHALNNH